MLFTAHLLTRKNAHVSSVNEVAGKIYSLYKRKKALFCTLFIFKIHFLKFILNRLPANYNKGLTFSLDYSLISFGANLIAADSVFDETFEIIFAIFFLLIFRNIIVERIEGLT